MSIRRGRWVATAIGRDVNISVRKGTCYRFDKHGRAWRGLFRRRDEGVGSREGHGRDREIRVNQGRGRAAAYRADV